MLLHSKLNVHKVHREYGDVFSCRRIDAKYTNGWSLTAPGTLGLNHGLKATVFGLGLVLEI